MCRPAHRTPHSSDCIDIITPPASQPQASLEAVENAIEERGWAGPLIFGCKQELLLLVESMVARHASGYLIDHVIRGEETGGMWPRPRGRG